MASLIEDSGKSGRTWRVQVMIDGARRTIRLGKMSKVDAGRVLEHVEALASARIAGSAPTERTATWLASVPETLRRRLANAGLCDAPADAAPAMTVNDLIDHYKAHRFKGLSKLTHLANEQAFGSMRLTLGGETPVADVTPAAAEDMRQVLLEGGLAEATVRKRCSTASKLFRYARRRRWVDRDPFDDAEVPRSAVATKRKAFINEPDAKKVLDELPNAQWRALFALARWGGLRVGSEPRRLTWADIDWGRGWLNVNSQKTGLRRVPLFPELATALREWQEIADELEPLVLPMLSGRTDASLRKTLENAIKRAGLKVWPRLWHNLRASRQTELEAVWPTHVACAWMGNSKPIAEKHYLMVTDEDFAKASAVTQNPAHSGGKDRENDGKPATPRKRKTPVSTVFPALSGGSKIAREGLEPPTKGL